MHVNVPIDVAQTVACAGLALWQKSDADGSAAAATAETVIGGMGPGVPSGQGIGLGSVKYIPAAALTGDPTNNATITVNKRTAGGAAVPIATLTTTAVAGNWVAWVPVTIPLVANQFISPGDVLTVAITKGGTGVVVPQGQLEVYPSAV